MSRQRGRTQACGQAEARTRAESAAKFLEVALLIDIEDEGAFRSVAASLAVLAGITAADAACCVALGRRSRGNDHHDAEALVAEIAPGGTQAATWLRRLIDLKDTAQYGIIFVSRDDLKVATRQGEKLVEFAHEVIRC
jgi:hypothetical protein